MQLGDRVIYRLTENDVDHVRTRQQWQAHGHYFHTGRELPAIVTGLHDWDPMVDLQIFAGPATLWRLRVLPGQHNGEYHI